MTAALVVAVIAAAAGWAAFLAQLVSNRHLRDQNRILERQVEGEEAGRAEARRARLFCPRGGRSGMSFWVEVENAGPAPASNVRIWLEDQDGNAVTSPGTFQGLLASGMSARSQTPIFDDLIGRGGPYFLGLGWTDGAGEHLERVEGFDVRLR